VNWHRFFFRTRRKPQSYRQYKKSRERRAGYAARYAAEHAPETFQAVIRLADGTTWECEHAHRTRSAARECGERAGLEVLERDQRG
jgi:hypothetical protein